MKRYFKHYLILSLIAILFFGSNNQGRAACEKQLSVDEIYADVPFAMQRIESTCFPNYEISIISCGAKSNSETLNTSAINNAIKKVHDHGGGRVVIPEGLWITGPITLLSNVDLHANRGAIIMFTKDKAQYPIISTNFEGEDTYRCQSPISARNAENIAITGEGIFDGSGDEWRPIKRDKIPTSQWAIMTKNKGVVSVDKKIWYPSESSARGASLSSRNFNIPQNLTEQDQWESIHDWLRPVMVSLIKCNKVLLNGATFKNSPSWCLHPLSCTNITIDDVKVFNPWYAQNGDALDLESCNKAIIINSTFDAGDDAICIKSGKDANGRKRGEACQNVVIKNNRVLHGHGGFTVGSEMSGGVKNIYVSDCSFLGTDVGVRFKSTRGRGGVVENIYIKNIHMINITNEALIFDLYYSNQSANDTTDSRIPLVTIETPIFRNINISNIACNGAGRAIFFNGLPEMKIQNVVIKNVSIINAENGGSICQADHITMDKVNITSNNQKEGIKVSNTNDLKINNTIYKNIGSEEKIVDLK